MCEQCGIREFVFKKDPMEQFVSLALSQREMFKNVIYIAHNSQDLIVSLYSSILYKSIAHV
jgi:hypothetical protein